MNYITIKNLPTLPFDVNEAINQLRINLSFCGTDVKTIMVTSSVPNEGKSFICVNLWRSLAKLGNKVLLIDCDLRNSEMRTKYGLSSTEAPDGIAHYLSGQSHLQDVICGTNVENGDMIPLEGTVPNPVMLLESHRFERMLRECAKYYDYIILDTPPLASVADAMKIATHCDGTMLVVRSHSTPRKLVMESLQQLRRTGKPVLGTVLNRVESGTRKSAYYNRYYRYGGYYKKYGQYGSYGQYGKANKVK